MKRTCPCRRRDAAFLALALAVAGCARDTAPDRDPLTMSLPYEIDSLDPHARNIVGSFAIASHFYEPLVTTDASLALRPGLAERWDNPDAMTWIFHLRRGVRFHSGKRLTSRDVVASFERLAATPGLEMGAYLANVESVTATDPATVVLRTRAPSAILLSAVRFVLIVPEGADPAFLASQEDGTGPYRLQSWTRGQEIRMVRNDAYEGPAPDFASVVARLDRSPMEAIEDLEAGASDLVQGNTKAVEPLVQATKGLRLVRKTSLFMKYLAFDLARDRTPLVDAPENPFQKHAVREAVSLAIDRPALVRSLSTYARPASQPVPPLVFGYDPSIPVPTPDPDRARRLLSEAGYPDGFTVTLTTRNSFEETARIVADMLAPVGIRVRLAVLSDPEFFDQMSADRLSFVLSRLGCPTGDADLVLEQRFRTPVGGRTWGRGDVFSPPGGELDEAIDASAGILAMAERRVALQHLMRRVVEAVYWVPLNFDEEVYALRSGLVWQPRSDSYVLAAEVRRPL